MSKKVIVGYKLDRDLFTNAEATRVMKEHDKKLNYGSHHGGAVQKCDYFYQQNPMQKGVKVTYKSSIPGIKTVFQEQKVKPVKVPGKRGRPSGSKDTKPRKPRAKK